MIVVSVGDLLTDYYYKNGTLLSVNGGMTSHNIIANLAKMGLPTSVYACCGNDIEGTMAIKSLEQLKVDVSNIKRVDDVRTRCFHISYTEDGDKLSFTSKKRCPFCNNKKWYDESLIDCNYILNHINEDDILIFDNLNDKNQNIIDNTKNKKIIDLGQYFELENLSPEIIINKIQGKFEIINFNERVTKYLLNKLNLASELEIYNCLKPNFMTITRGADGATFIYDGMQYDFSLITTGKTVDSTGAGDAFISSIIKDYIKNNYHYDADLFQKWYENSNKLTSKVVSKMGARGHINSLFKVKKINDECTCNNFNYVERKQIKRCNININNLETRIINAINSQVSDNINNINFNEFDNCLFIGTGGSYAGAYFTSKVINKLYGCNTYALYPRDVLYRNNKNINKVVLFSYSGTTNDIINCVKDFKNDEIYIITKGEIQDIVVKTRLSKGNIMSYRTPSNKGKERGFLSFEGTVSPSAIFLKYYYSIVDNKFDVNAFITESINYWNKQINALFDNNIMNMIKQHNLINIFRGDYTDTACFDLESKIIESGLFNCIVHEKKNFSHGRFINYENQKNNCSIYFKQKYTSNYEAILLDYLDNNTVVVESRFDGILAEFDLLIASQFIIYYIGKSLDVDVSKPKYSRNALKIYFYKGTL